MSNVVDAQCKRVNGTVGSLSYKASRGDRIEISEWGRTWKEVIMVYVEVKSQHLSKGTEKKTTYTCQHNQCLDKKSNQTVN
jgi:hypothetical protein